MTSQSQSKLSHLLLMTAVVFGTQAALGDDASADTVSVAVGGSAHVDAGVHVNVDGFIGALAHLEAGISVGVGFSAPPPAPPPPPVPSYYVEYVAPAPVYAPPQPLYLDRPIVQPRAPMSRWGLGAFAGSVHIDDQEAGSDLGLVGRYRLSRSWSLEGEVAKTKSTGGARVDRRVGGAVIWNLPLGRKLKPSLLLGAGYGQSELGHGEFHAEQGYGEVGFGLSYRLTKRFRIMADVRTGTRSSGDEDVMYVAKGGVVEFDQDEDYSRARLGGIFYF